MPQAHRFSPAFRSSSKLRTWIVSLILLVALATSTGFTSPSYFYTKLSGEMPDFSDAYGINISPDGSLVLFQADRVVNGMSELYSVPARGGDLRKLNETLVNGGSVWGDYQISADGQWVVYRADQVVDERNQIFSVPIRGGTVHSLSPNATNLGASVSSFTVSKDSQHVVYKVTSSTEPDALYSISITGGIPVQLHSDLEFDDRILGIGKIAFCEGASEQRLVFVAKASLGEPWALYSIRLNGEDRKTLASPSYGSGVWSYKITPDCSKVVYSAYQNSTEAMELYSVPITGGASTRLSPDPVVNPAMGISDFLIFPNNAGVVYLADQEVDSKFELYSVSMNGLTRYKLSDNAMIPAGDVVDDFVITKNSLGVVYRADSDHDEAFELFSVYFNGTGRNRLHPALPADRSVTSFTLTPNHAGVVFYSNQAENGIRQLYSNSVLGNELHQLTFAENSFFVTSDYGITPDSLYVAYLADQDTDNQFEMYGVSIFGGASIKLSGPVLNPDGDVNGFWLLPDSRSFLYFADAEVDEKMEVFAALPGIPGFLPMIIR